ncbi:MAG: hypothetical protein WEB50_10735 [Vicinamibacterales bacterium]
MKHNDADRKSKRKTARAGAGNTTRTPEAAAPPAGIATAPAPFAPATGLSRGEATLALCSRPSAEGSTTPIFHGSNPVGDALISTGLVDLAGPTLTSMVPLLPVGMAGLEVRESLHRFDANAYAPSLESGLAADNRVGEALGSVTMRWLLAPDDFEATPAGTPPATEIAPSKSQRFVMLGGRVQFTDRRQGVLRFFGAGRTFPTTADGRSRLMFAGTATVLEGLGSQQGARGTLLVSGEVTTPGAITMTIVGRLDPDGPLQPADALGPFLDAAAAADAASDRGAEPRRPVEPSAKAGETVFVFRGEANDVADEHLRPARIGNDIGNSGQLRSLVRTGTAVGTVAGSRAFDATDHRCSVSLTGARRELTLTDHAGRRIGTIAANALDGTAFRDVRQGQPVQRLIACGALSDGTGALDGAAGVVTFDTIVAGNGASSSLYVVRLADPSGRFRATYNEVPQPMQMPSGGALPMAPPMQFVGNTNGTRISEEDQAILAHAERTLAEGVEVQRWWEEKDRVGDYAERFDVVREFNQDDRSFGFFDRAPAGGRTIPVMGIVQEMFYDRQKQATGEAIRAQLQEFVLRYFMRVSHLRQPEAYAEAQRTPRSGFQRALSWLPDEGERRVGFGYQQLYYKLAGSGLVGKFSEDERSAIVDLRDIGKVYSWILLKVDIFDFNLSFSPFGSEAMKFQMPLKESTYLVLGPRFVTNREKPEPGVLGEYGFGYAFVPYAPHPGPIAYGPGHFAAAVQSVDFKVMENGEIRARAAFIVNRPDQIAKIDIDPIDWGFQMADMMTFNLASRLMNPFKAMAQRLPLRVSGVDPIASYIWMANTMTGGMAGRQLGISKEVLEKRMLVQHFMQHYAMLINSLLVWRMIPDWTDHERLPEFCDRGVRC